MIASPSAETLWVARTTTKSWFRESGCGRGSSPGAAAVAIDASTASDMSPMVAGRRRRIGGRNDGRRDRYDSPMDRREATEALIAAGRRLGQRGLISGGEGNLSIRLDADRLLTSPTGRRKDELGPTTSSSSGSTIRSATSISASGLAPSSDLAIHLALYRVRPDIAAVVHAHLPASMALTLAGERPDPTALPETAYHLPRLPFVAAGEMGSADVAERVAAALSEPPAPLPNAAILERHGAVRGRRRPDGRGRPTRARRGALPDVARRAPDSRGTCHAGYGVTRLTRHGVGGSDGGTMNARAYLAELVGTILFLTLGLRLGRRDHRRRGPDQQPARRPVRVRARAARGGLHVRARLGRALQPGRDHRDGPRQADHARSTPSATSSPRSSARSSRPRHRHGRGQPADGRGRHHEAGDRHDRRRRADPRDGVHGRRSCWSS